MNNSLTQEIVKHVYKKLGLFGTFTNFHSILDDKFLIDKKISFTDEDENLIENKIWISQLTYEDKKIRLLVANCSLDVDSEYCMIISIDNTPSFGCYLLSDQSESIISYLVNEQWMTASTYLQATFLAGMEQLKETMGEWSKCKDHKDLYDSLLLFVKYCDGELDAR